MRQSVSGACVLGVGETTVRRYLEYGVEIRCLKVDIVRGRLRCPERSDSKAWEVV